MKIKYLVTGGCGFVGSNLAAEVLRRDGELVLFDNLSRAGSRQNLDWLRSRGCSTFVFGDIRNRDDVESTIKEHKPDVVFHLAGQVAMTTSVSRPYLDFQTNTLGTVNLLESLRLYLPKTPVLYSSTNKVYGDLLHYSYDEERTRYRCREYPEGFPETIPLDFTTPYGCSKGSADQYLLDYHRMFGLPTVVFRHSSMYGSRQFATYDQGWVGWFVSQALIGAQNSRHSFSVSGDGKQVRDLLYVEDVVQLYMTTVQRIDRAMGKAFNVGGGYENSSSIVELISFLQETLGTSLNVQHIDPRPHDQLVFVSDNTKIHRTTGWKPKVESRLGIQEMLGWVTELSKETRGEH